MNSFATLSAQDAAHRAYVGFTPQKVLKGRAADLSAAIQPTWKIKPVLASRYLVKGWLDRGAASVLYADPNDPGQLLLWEAAHSGDSYPFRLVFPDGATARGWFALVIRIGEVFDTANSVMKLQVDIKPTSDISRNGGT